MNEDTLFQTSETLTDQFLMVFVSKGEKSIFRDQISKTVDLSLRSLKCQAYAVQFTCTAVPPGASSEYNTAVHASSTVYPK